MSKIFQDKKRNKNKNNNLEEPLKDIELEIIKDDNKILSLDSDNNEIQDKKNNEMKKSFCSKLFFLWTLIVMKLSNQNKLKSELLALDLLK